ncbi:MAG: hypothetical protein KAJ07_05380 [Planctomycetes bacterium]|nr:hypothetical protein [Planctomycetota bacterium]
METQVILEQLLDLLSDNGITVRSEPLGGRGGGLCKLKDRHIFYNDTDATAAQNAHTSAKAVHNIVDIEAVYLRPQVREFIENCKPSPDHAENTKFHD